MFLTLLTFLSAISISLIAAGYSIIGLATLFAGAAMPIIAMGSALEIGKLVAASWLYNNWGNSFVPKTLKAYLFSAIIVLIFITSMGIFGFLSKAHLDQVKPTSSNSIKIEVIDNQIKQQNTIITRAENTLEQLDRTLEVYVKNEYATRMLRERKKQEAERTELNNAIKNATNEIAKLTDEKASLQLAQDKIEAEVGPIKYIAELIYGDDAKSHFDEAVRIVILILIFVFDPLAVLLLIAANISLRTIRERKEKNKKFDEKKIRDQNKKLSDKNKEIAEKLKSYTSFFEKLGKRDLKNRDYESFFKEYNAKDLVKLGLDPDEIRLKLDQIMEWNEGPSKPPSKYAEVGIDKKDKT